MAMPAASRTCAAADRPVRVRGAGCAGQEQVASRTIGTARMAVPGSIRFSRRWFYQARVATWTGSRAMALVRVLPRPSGTVRPDGLREDRRFRQRLADELLGDVVVPEATPPPSPSLTARETVVVKTVSRSSVELTA
jgi:hypothetical protein